MRMRDVKKEELSIIWELIKQESFELNEEILNNIYDDAIKFISFENINIGFAFIMSTVVDDIKHQYEIGLFISPKHRKKGYGRILINEIEMLITNDSNQEIKIENMLKYYDSSEFLKKLGYEMWYSSSLMEYKGAKFDGIDLDLVEYDESYYEDMSALRTEAFYEVRKVNDITPFEVEPCDSEREIMLQTKECYKLLVENNKLIGATKTSNGYIDLVMVDRECRGKGIGGNLIKYSTNRILNEGYESAKLYIMDTNSSARILYESLGYSIESTVHVYRKYL